MRNQIRTALLKRIRPLTDNFTARLLELAALRVEAELERLPEAIEVALSAFESNAQPDLIERTLGPELAAMLKPRHAKSSRVGYRTGRHDDTTDNEPPLTPVKTGACGAESRGASNWACQLPKGHEGWHWSEHVGGWGDPPKPIAAPKKDRDLKPANVEQDTARAGEQGTPRVPVNKGKQQVCSACGYVGGNKRGCGRSHPTQAAPIAGVDIARDGSPVVAVHSPPVDRCALIAARATKPPIEDRDASADREPWSTDRLKEETELAENRKHDGELPQPRSTFRVTTTSSGDLDDLEEVTGTLTPQDLAPEAELDFGGAA